MKSENYIDKIHKELIQIENDLGIPNTISKQVKFLDLLYLRCLNIIFEKAKNQQDTLCDLLNKVRNR